jgi:thioredoxin
MKKIGYLSALIVFLLVSCSGSPAGDKGTSAGNTGASNAQSQVADGKPEHLTEKTFKLKIMDYDKNPQQWVYLGDKPAIVDFYADWCRPCRMIGPYLEELAAEYDGKITVYKVNTDEERELAAAFGITSLPTVLFIPMVGKPSTQIGALPKESYKKIIDEVLLKTTSTIKN